MTTGGGEMKRRDPWMKFFPADWRADPALRLCSMAARGLWIEMLGVMYEATRRGHLLIKGAVPSPEQLAIVVGCGTDECVALLAELERNGVFSRKRNGVIYSRRMEADEIKSSKNRDNGRKGGNPALRSSPSNPTDNPPPDNRRLIREDKAHIPEARSQRREEKKDSPPPPPSPDPARDPEAEAEGRATFFANVVSAAGYNPSDVLPTHWMPPRAEIEVLSWLDLPGMTEALAIQLVRVSTAAKGRSRGPLAFRDGLRALSATLIAPPIPPPERAANVVPLAPFDLDAFKRNNPGLA